MTIRAGVQSKHDRERWCYITRGGVVSVGLWYVWATVELRS